MEFGPAETDANVFSWVANELARSWGRGARWVRDGEPHPREAQHLKLDTSKARAILNWQPVLPLVESLEWIVEWYRAYQNHRDLASLTRLQIARYDLAPAQHPIQYDRTTAPNGST